MTCEKGNFNSLSLSISQSDHERYLAEHYCKGPVFITHYPAAIKPFYMRRSDIDGDGVSGVGGVGGDCVGGSTVEATDLLVPGIGELIGGSAREERLDVLHGLMADAGLLQGGGDEGGEGGGKVAAPSSNLQWYADLRKYGTVPHAGWGMGFERLVQVGVQWPEAKPCLHRQHIKNSQCSL